MNSSGTKELEKENEALRRRVAELEAEASAVGPGGEVAGGDPAVLPEGSGGASSPDETSLVDWINSGEGTPQLLQSVLDVYPYPVSLKDREARYIMVNRAMSDFYKTPREDFIGRTSEELGFHSAHSGAEIAQSDRHVLETGERVDIEETRAGPVSAMYWRRLVKEPLRGPDGGIDGVITATVDLTRSKQAEEEARTTQDRLVDALDSMPSALYLFDREERLVAWNSKVIDYIPTHRNFLKVGMPLEEVVRRSAREKAYSAEMDEEAWVAKRLEDHRNPGPPVEQQLRDGRWLQATVHHTADGGMISVRTDITELKRREHQLSQAQRMDAVGQIAGGIAHDFNNLLQIIIGHAQLAVNSSDIPKSIADDLRTVLEMAGRGADLTRQLLAFSRQESFQKKALDLNLLIADQAEMVRRTIGEHISLEVHSPDAPLWVLADAGRIEQVLLNLYLNARDAMPGGGKIEVTPRVARRGMGTPGGDTGEETDYAEIEIKDNGAGMAPDVLEHVFEPFFTTKEVGEGTGLGLSTAYGIVEQHGGRIEVESALGQGASFRVYLPTDPALVPETSQEKISPPPAAEGVTILLAEDEPHVRLLMKRILELHGHRILLAADGHEALNTFREHRDGLDLVILDAVMPKLMGSEVFREIRNEAPHLPVIFCTGYSPDNLADDLYRGAADILTKPVTIEALGAAVNKALGKDRALETNG